MTKVEMKKLIKPLVKQCLQEMLLEEGLLSNLVSEVMKGQKSVIVEAQAPVKNSVLATAKTAKPVATNTKLNAIRKQMADAIGGGAYGNVFEGLTPVGHPPEFSGTSVDGIVEEMGDPGIDLSMLSMVPGIKGFKK